MGHRAGSLPFMYCFANRPLWLAALFEFQCLVIIDLLEKMDKNTSIHGVEKASKADIGK